MSQIISQYWPAGAFVALLCAAVGLCLMNFKLAVTGFAEQRRAQRQFDADQLDMSRNRRLTDEFIALKQQFDERAAQLSAQQKQQLWRPVEQLSAQVISTTLSGLIDESQLLLQDLVAAAQTAIAAIPPLLQPAA
jgi:hypothetical protein